MNAKSEILGVQTRFDRAELNDDRHTLGELIADDFLSIGPKGFMLDKRQWIDRHDQFRYDSLETTDVDVRIHGDTAVVRDIQRNRATYDDQAVALSLRVSQTWVREGEGWQLVGIQFSPLDDGPKH